MLLDETSIVAQNTKYINESPSIQRNLGLAGLCTDVLRAYAVLPDLQTDNDITVLRLAVRLINAAGACGQCALSGYYQPAVAQIRDIVEVGFLLDLFARQPQDVARWRSMATKDDREYFKIVNVRKKLDQLSNSTERRREAAYKFYSRHGTHADAWAVELISPDMSTRIGPFPDATRVEGVSFDLAKYLSLSTFFLIRGVDRTRIQDSASRMDITNRATAVLKAMDIWKAAGKA